MLQLEIKLSYVQIQLWKSLEPWWSSWIAEAPGDATAQILAI